MSSPIPPTYRTTNWRAYNAALKQRGSLKIWFDPETVGLAEPSRKRGRSATFTDAAIQACLTLKVLFGLPLRQATGLVASLLQFAGLDWAVPHFSTLSRPLRGRYPWGRTGAADRWCSRYCRAAPAGSREAYAAQPDPMLSHINVGTGVDCTTRDLAETIAVLTGFTGQLVFDHTKPDGAPRKLMYISKLNAFGRPPAIGLREGRQSSYDWFVANQDKFRG
jgi:hypothetical protein